MPSGPADHDLLQHGSTGRCGRVLAAIQNRTRYGALRVGSAVMPYRGRNRQRSSIAGVDVVVDVLGWYS